LHAIEDLKLKGVKFGPIYNGVALSDPRLVPVYEYLQKNNIPLTMHLIFLPTAAWARLRNWFNLKGAGDRPGARSSSQPRHWNDL
jgi:predicted TIM-barrel fold metal-dependent hydrolase